MKQCPTCASVMYLEDRYMNCPNCGCKLLYLKEYEKIVDGKLVRTAKPPTKRQLEEAEAGIGHA